MTRKGKEAEADDFGFLRWLTLSLPAYPELACHTADPVAAAGPDDTDGGDGENSVLQSAETLNKRSGTPSTPLMTGGVQPVLAQTPLNLWNAVPVIHRRAQRAKPKILAVPVGRLVCRPCGPFKENKQTGGKS
ncbi:MAG: hypothetical protein ACLVJ6_02815 [Merdibacter sp.]